MKYISLTLSILLCQGLFASQVLSPILSFPSYDKQVARVKISCGAGEESSCTNITKAILSVDPYIEVDIHFQSIDSITEKPSFKRLRSAFQNRVSFFEPEFSIWQSFIRDTGLFLADEFFGVNVPNSSRPDNSNNSNLMCEPYCTGGAQAMGGNFLYFPGNKITYGIQQEAPDARIMDRLTKLGAKVQAVDLPPIGVGHIDEFYSYAPVADGIVLFVASPSLFMDFARTQKLDTKFITITGESYPEDPSKDSELVSINNQINSLIKPFAPKNGYLSKELPQKTVKQLAPLVERLYRKRIRHKDINISDILANEAKIKKWLEYDKTISEGAVVIERLLKQGCGNCNVTVVKLPYFTSPYENPSDASNVVNGLFINGTFLYSAPNLVTGSRFDWSGRQIQNEYDSPGSYFFPNDFKLTYAENKEYSLFISEIFREAGVNAVPVNTTDFDSRDGNLHCATLEIRK